MGLGDTKPRRCTDFVFRRLCVRAEIPMFRRLFQTLAALALAVMAACTTAPVSEQKPVVLLEPAQAPVPVYQPLPAGIEAMATLPVPSEREAVATPGLSPAPTPSFAAGDPTLALAGPQPPESWISPALPSSAPAATAVPVPVVSPVVEPPPSELAANQPTATPLPSLLPTTGPTQVPTPLSTPRLTLSPTVVMFFTWVPTLPATPQATASPPPVYLPTATPSPAPSPFPAPSPTPAPAPTPSLAAPASPTPGPTSSPAPAAMSSPTPTPGPTPAYIPSPTAIPPATAPPAPSLSPAPAVTPVATLPLQIVSVTSPVNPGDNATLVAATAPGAQCEIVVTYSSGRSQAAGLIPKAADAAGNVSWTWRVGSATNPGRWRIDVTAGQGGQTVSQTVYFTVQ